MMPETELAQRVRDAQARNEESFRVLVAAFYPMVYGLALSAIGDRTEAEDVAQDAFVAAWTHMDRLQEPRAFPGWMRTITRNLARTYLRSEEYRRRLRASVASGVGVPTNQEDAMEQAARDDARREVMAALKHVSPAAREALVLFYLEQRSVAEAAAMLGIGENAFKVRLHAGRRQLRATIVRQAEADLQDALSLPSPSSQTSRIMAGLAAGPVMASVADAAAKTGIGLSWTSVQQHLVWDRIAWGGFIVSKKVVGIGVAVLAMLLAGTWWYQEHSSNAHSTAAVPSALQAAAHFERQRDTNSIPVEGESPSGIAQDPSEPAASTAGLAANQAPDDSSALTFAAAPYERPAPGAIDDPSKYASVFGFVVDGHGMPIAGARVRASVGPELSDPAQAQSLFESLYASDREDRHYEATTDRRGAYTIRGLAYEGNLRVTASAKGFYYDSRGGEGAAVVKAGDTVGPVNVVLQPGVTLHGRVLTRADEPVTGAIVRLVRYRSKGGTRTGMLGTAQTDDRGEFQMGFVRAGQGSFVVSSPTWGVSSFEDIGIGDEEIVVLRMRAPASVAGAIRYVSGEPASGVEVRLMGYGRELEGNSAPPGSALAALTDATGAYRLDNLDAQLSYTASVYAIDGTPLAAPERLPAFAEGATSEWNATLQAPMIVAGHVYGATTGKPLRDIRVAAMHDGALIEDSGVAVDSGGAYTLTLLASPGDYVILAIPWRVELDEANLEHGVPVRLGPGEMRNLDLTFPDTFSLSVQVVDSAGAPIEGVTTAITEDDHTWSPAGQTDAEGRFTWAGFRAGTTGQILLLDNRMPIAVTEAVTGDAGVDYPEQVITLAGNGGIEGTAVGGTGQPLANGLLLVEVTGREGAPVGHQAPTDVTGHFLIGSGIPATGVVLHIIGYTEDAQGISRHGTGDIELEVEADHIVDLGAVSFFLEETGLQP